MTSQTLEQVRPVTADVGAVAFVQASHLGKLLDPAQLQRLLAGGELLELPPGVAVITQGTPGGKLFMIIDGQVRVTRAAPNGDEPILLATLERPKLFGEMSVLTGNPHTATVTTTSDSRLVRFPGELIRQLADEAPTLGRRLSALMAGRRKDTDRRFGSGT